MAKIIEYKLDKARFADDLHDTMKQQLAEGWQPQGGVAYSQAFFYQAMVKYEEQETIDLEAMRKRSLKMYRDTHPGATPENDKVLKAMELTPEEKEMIKGSIFDPNT